MTCREVADFLAGYLSGSLDEEVRAAFEGHLSVCPNCVAYLATYRTAIAAGRRAFTAPDADSGAEVPADMINAIMSVLRK
jgi:anti-sigma factor RsiW